MPSLEKNMQRRDMFRSRMELMRMLDELSDIALEYVWRPITYAHCLTDGHSIGTMTHEDMDRFGLIVSAANDLPEVVRKTNLYRLAVCRDQAIQRRRAEIL